MPSPSDTVAVTTPACPYCGKASVLNVSIDGFAAMGAGALVQEAFPELSKDEREMLLTGLHPDCFDAFVPED